MGFHWSLTLRTADPPAQLISVEWLTAVGRGFVLSAARVHDSSKGGGPRQKTATLSAIGNTFRFDQRVVERDGAMRTRTFSNRFEDGDAVDRFLGEVRTPAMLAD
jgi:hypothetical protein